MREDPIPVIPGDPIPVSDSADSYIEKVPSLLNLHFFQLLLLIIINPLP